MDDLQNYAPVVRALARKYANGSSDFEDLEQEGYLKLHKFIRSRKTPYDPTSEDWKKQIYVIVRNCMIDCFRRSRSYKRVFCSLENKEFFDNLVDSSEESAFNKVARSYAILELERLLPSFEKTILRELVSPSEEYRIFLRKKRAISKIFYGGTRKFYNFNVENLAQFVGSTRDGVLEAFSNIRRIKNRSSFVNVEKFELDKIFRNDSWRN